MSTVPKIWVLLGDKAGGNGQLTSLADALEWPYETKRLRYNLLNHCPNLFLGASILSVDRLQSSPLEAPWPDLVLAASRRSAPVARWIKKQSGGRARLVHLIHTQAPLHLFDLVITTPQYRLPLRPNVLHNTAPLNRPAPDRLAAAASRWQVRLGNLPRPYTALLVGGNSSVYELDPATAINLARLASAQVRKVGGSLLVTTSPRTPASVVEAVFAALDCPAHCYRWRPNDTDNPYLAYLALADSFIVTIDSASQVVEACVTNKPVYVFTWPTRARSPFRVGVFRRWLQPQGHGLLRQSRRLAQLYDQLVYWGFIRPTRDFAASLQILTQKGLIAQLGSVPDSQLRQPLDDMERTVTRIRQLFAVHGPMTLPTAPTSPSAPCRQRFIVVLGAGRSGTSTITRGLRALGVELGDQLRPGGGKNPLGFFEDEGLLKLNKRLRATLGLRADSVSLIQPHQWQMAAVQTLAQEAQETIRRRFGRYSLPGYKFAGTLRVLPFWRMVFQALDVDVRYVMVVRNPISVARSRAQLNPRRGVQEKSDLEWLVNVVPYFRAVRERPFVVVDYDLVMTDAVTQLERIATTLDLPLTAATTAGIQEYAKQFLHPNLRHYHFTEEDLINNPQVNSLTRDAYRWLHRLATDSVEPYSPQIWHEWEQIENALSAQAPFLRYVDQLEAELRRAKHSMFGPLQLIPQAWLNMRKNWNLTRIVLKLKISAQELRRHQLPSDT